MDELQAWVDTIEDPDELYTMTTRLMWHLYERAQEDGDHRLAEDLLAAFTEVGCGPWRYPVSAALVRIELPLPLLASLLDRMVDRLEALTPGFGARVVIARVRSHLDPGHSTRGRN